MKKTFLILAVLMVFAANIACAATASPWTTETGWSHKAGKKLEFGATNLFFGWTEIFSQPASHTGSAQEFLKAVGQGLANAVVYTLGGALHVITFPVPVDVPIPNGGVKVK